MADSLCGPSNGAKNLVGHVDRDRSLQQDRMVNGAPANSQSTFRSQPAHAGSADQAFAGFQQNGLQEPTTSMPLPGQLPIPHYPGPVGFPSAPALQHRHGMNPASSFALADPSGQSWVSQFSGMQLQDPTAHMSAPILPQHQHQAPAVNNMPFASAPLNRGFAGGNFAFQSFQPGAAPMLAPDSAASFGNQTQTFGMQNIESTMDTEAFNRAFGEYDEAGFQDDVAKWAADGTAESEKATTDQQLPSEAQVAAPDPVLEEEQQKEPTASQVDPELADAANAILHSVRGNDSEKFKNSNFFELMRRIGNHEVVVSGPNLVDAATGETISKPEPQNAIA